MISSRFNSENRKFGAKYFIVFDFEGLLARLPHPWVFGMSEKIIIYTENLIKLNKIKARGAFRERRKFSRIIYMNETREKKT